MPPQWRVVGGADRGGILVREAQALASPQTSTRLATGSLIQELQLVGERLHYKLVQGSGPPYGWVSLQVSGKELVVRTKEDPAPQRRPETEQKARPGVTGIQEQRKEIKADTARSKPDARIDGSLSKRKEEESKKRVKNGDFLKYCLKYSLLGYPLPDCKLRVICFPHAAGTESTYTASGTPFLTWVKQTKKVEICAMDFPGRNKLLTGSRHTSIDTLAPELLAVMQEKLSDGVPYVVWAHSVGAWVAFEFLLLARRRGLPMPKACLFMASPAPHLPEEERLWHRSAELDDLQLREEVTNWDREHFEGPGKIIFEIGWKNTWAPIFRSDFRLFDEYEFRHSEAARFDFPIHAWHFEREHYTKPGMIELWREWTTADFDFRIMEGMGHLTCIYQKELKRQYFQNVTETIKGYADL